MSNATRFSRADRFGSTRFYDIPAADGFEPSRLPSVTSILGAVNKPALVPWAARTERDAVMRAAADLYEDLPMITEKLPRSAYLSTLNKRLGLVRAHVKASAKAMNIGSEAHALIEWELRRSLGQVVGPEPSAGGPARAAYDAYDAWQQRVHLKPLLIEQTVWSRRHGYAGTMDLFAELDHEGARLRAVGDWKTSKGIWPEMLLQVAAYGQALTEMGYGDAPVAWPPTSGFIVRLPKVVGDPDVEIRMITPEQQARAFKVFLAVLELWKWLDEQ